MKTPEELAIEVGNDPVKLRERLMYTRDCLKKEWKDLFQRKKMDFPNKRMISDCGRFAIQWKLRPNPDEPTSYENQQTNCGSTDIVRI